MSGLNKIIGTLLPTLNRKEGEGKIARKEKSHTARGSRPGGICEKSWIIVPTHSTESRFNRFGTLFAELVRQYNKLVGNKATVPRLKLLESLCI